MSTPPTSFPTPGQDPNWGNQLVNAITDRDAIIQAVAEGKVSPEELQAAINTATENKVDQEELQTAVGAVAGDLSAHTSATQDVHGITDTGDLTDVVQAVESGRLSQSALDDAYGGVPDITVDTSVGTRVFIGGVMVYGDTGWRVLARWQEGQVTEGTIPAGFEPNSSSTSRPGGIFIMRQGGLVTLAIAEARTTTNNPTVSLPIGFRGNANPPYPAVPLSYRVSGGDYALSLAEVGAALVRLRVPSDSLLSTQGAGGYGITFSWPTNLAWPSSLPWLPY